MSKKRGKLIIITAPSGAGKTTMTRRLLGEFENIRFSVSATTRPRRPDERAGVDYHFLSPKEFQDKIDAGEFLEWEEFYNGNRYGTLRSDVENQRDKGYYVLLDIDVLGAENVKRMFGDEALGIFIAPPSLDILKERLEKRGTETDETMELRLTRAEDEMRYAGRFDLAIVNDKLEVAYQELKNAVTKFMKGF